MKRMLPMLGVAGAALLTIVSGVIYGRMSERWGPSNALVEAGRKLEACPEDFASWKQVKSNDITPRVRDMLLCRGHLHRIYKNDLGAVVNVAVLLGPAGPISVHTPEICYSSRHFKQTIQRQATKLDPLEHSLWKLGFQSKRVDGQLLVVYYGWYGGKSWSAAEDARFAYMGRPWLYKIQLSSAVPFDADGENDDACAEFLRDFLPVLQKHLVDPTAK